MLIEYLAIFTQKMRYEKLAPTPTKPKIVIENFNGKVNGNGSGNTKKGKIKMSLWDLPPIGSLKLDSATFAESNVWLPGPDLNQRRGG